MSNRAEPFTAAQRADIGRLVLAAREAGTCWKELERTFDRSRMQLNRYVAEALMLQDFVGMLHPQPCDPALAA